MDTMDKLNSTKEAIVRRIFFVTMVFCLAVFLSAPRLVSAQVQAGPVTANELLPNAAIQPAIGLSNADIRVTIARIIRVAISLLGIVLLLYVLYGGFIWMTAAGDDKKIGEAKSIIVNGIIGLAIILSAYAIVTFVISKLLGATNSGGADNTTGSGVDITSGNFFGSGGLGSVIKDHYPGRDQQNVPRNTKIIISFRKAVVPSSFIDDTNGNGIIGDCKNIGATMVWKTDCDQLKNDDDFIKITRSDTGEAISGAVALISYESGKAYTVVIRPLDNLGSNSANVSYKVRVGKGIDWDDPNNKNPSIFAGRQSGQDYYEWSFTCNTTLDRQPPRVTSVFPFANTTEAKNSVIQINFSKPMDPMGLQGQFSASGNYFVLPGNTVFLRSDHSSVPAGNFRLVNNYQTLEFTPSAQCGFNSCGATVYCLPVCDSGTACSSDLYEVLVRAGQTFSADSFEAVPFSGAMDASGNALDNGDGRVNAVARTNTVFPAEEKSDNYFWKFNISNNIDATSPYIEQTHPGPDATYVAPDEEMSLIFSKFMRVDSLYNIDIQEQPVATEPLCKVPRYTELGGGTSKATLDHCPFLADAQHYYFPVVDSSVEDVHFNCFYPGKGPVGLDAQTKSSVICDSNHPQNCCDVSNTQTDAFCCNGLTNFADRQTCLSNLRAISQ